MSMETKYKFNKTCTTPYFLDKVKIAEYMIANFKHIKVYSSTSYEKSILVQDEKRGVFITIYIGRKCKGFGKGAPNRCLLNFHCPEHLNIHGAFLSKTDLNAYKNDMQIKKATE